MLQRQSQLDKPARLIIRLLFGFVSDSVFVSICQTQIKYQQILQRIAPAWVVQSKTDS